VQVHVEKTAPCVAKVSFSVPAEEFEGEVKKLLAQAGRNVRMKGFRPGHVPASVIEKHHGREVRQEARQRFLQEAYKRAVDEQKLRPLQHPRVDLPETEQVVGAPFGLEFEVHLRPEIELGEYKGLEVKSELEPVLDVHVENALAELAQREARLEPVGEEGLPENGMALCKIELLHDGEVVFTREGLRLGPTTAIPGVDAEEFKSRMSGAKDKSTFEIPVVFPADFEKEAARGQTGACRVHVDQAFRVILADRAELAKRFKLENEEALLAMVRTRLGEAHQQMEDQRIENALIERLIDSHEVDLPTEMIESQKQSRLAQIAKDLEARGTPEDKLDAETAAQEPAAREAAERAVKGYFLIEAIAQKEGLDVNQDELVAELRAIAQRNQSSFEEVRDYYREQNLIGQLAMEIVERKVRRFLRESAVVSAPS
jgi:trigger factor